MTKGKRNTILVVAAVLAAAWFFRRDSARLRVALAVSASLDHYAKGLVLGQPLSANAKKVPGSHWQRHVGFVGPATAGFTRAILIPRQKLRERVLADAEARLEAVQLDAANSNNWTFTLSELGVAFRRVPSQGCIRLSNGEYRQVHYWQGQEDAGGVAVISDMGRMDPSVTTAGPGTWSLFIWAGPFKGGETFAAAYDPFPCNGSNRPEVGKSVAASAAAMEGLIVALRDSLVGYAAASQQAHYDEVTNAQAPNACDVPDGSALTMSHQLVGFSIRLPADFVIEDQAKWDAEFARSGVARYAWRAPDGSVAEVESANPRVNHRGGLGQVSSECDTNIDGRPAHFDVGNASAGRPELTAGGAYDSYPNATLIFVGIGRSQQRQRELLAAAYSIRLNANWK